MIRHILSAAKVYAAAIVASLLSVSALLLYRKGKSDADATAKDEDHEHAQEIRRTVSVDRAKRMRELDDAGYRD